MGGHGGGSRDETSTAMLLMSPHFHSFNFNGIPFSQINQNEQALLRTKEPNYNGAYIPKPSMISLCFLMLSLSKSVMRLDLIPSFVMNNRFKYITKILVLQIDIVPTISILYALPLPLNNLGIFISDFLLLFKDYQILKILAKNGLQLSRLFDYYTNNHDSHLLKQYSFVVNILSFSSLIAIE